jgi:hypothetical protein
MKNKIDRIDAMLSFPINDKKRQSSLERCTVELEEFVEFDQNDRIYAAQDALTDYWGLISIVASEGYKTGGRGYVHIAVESLSNALDGDSLDGATIRYIPKDKATMTFLTLPNFGMVDRYNPKHEVVFLLECSDGSFSGTMVPRQNDDGLGLEE